MIKTNKDVITGKKTNANKDYKQIETTIVIKVGDYKTGKVARTRYSKLGNNDKTNKRQ